MGGHCYWDPGLTDAYIPNHAPYHAIACEVRKDGDGTEVGLIRDNTGYSMNHWIGVVRENDPHQYVHKALDPYSEAAVQMIAVYEGQGVHLLQTVADGDCGIDVCNMILGVGANCSEPAKDKG